MIWRKFRKIIIFDTITFVKEVLITQPMSNRPVLEKKLHLAGRDLILQTGNFAQQANGAVLVTYGDTVVLVTATTSESPREEIDFLPLMVDYEERLYAVGRIPGGFIKREGRPSEKAVLTSRLIDRPLRPLFPENYRNEIHIVATVFCVDQNNPPDIAALIGASAALAISDIPFEGPIGAVNIAYVDEKLVINPELENSEKSKLNLTVAGTEKAIIMVEAGASEVSEGIVLKGILKAHEEIKKIVHFINVFREEALEMGLAKKKRDVEKVDYSELEELVNPLALGRINEYLKKSRNEKWAKLERERQRREIIEAIIQEIAAKYDNIADKYPNYERNIKSIFYNLEKKQMRKMILEERIRVDGRAPTTIRPIECKAGIFPRTHGSGLFSRGETQVVTVTTLGAVSDEQILDGLDVEETKRFMHHYNFPSYSVGETRPIRGPGRREIGHGALAEKALEPLLPDEEEFPYTIRLVSEVLSSNGSTSMASVCASSLSLMDAGVPLKSLVAGVAMGLIKEAEQVEVLTDIQGMEDALGDMDFKVAGTANGITALQMDIKTEGIGQEILQKALEQAKEGRMYILNIMKQTISEPRAELSPYAPRIIRMKVDPDNIRDIIGPGGKTIKKIIEETGVDIDIEDDGRIFIASVDQEGSRKAVELINNLTQEVEIGKVYTGTVTRTTDFGAFVEIIPGVLGLPGKEGLVHISQLADERIGKVEDVAIVGDKIVVKAIGFDQQGRLKLSRKEAIVGDKNIKGPKAKDSKKIKQRRRRLNEK